MTEKAVRIALLLVTGGISSAASIGALVHTYHLKQEVLIEQEERAQVAPAKAPTLTLKSGATLDGQIIGMTDKWVKIRVPDMGDMTIPREQITAIGNRSPAPSSRSATTPTVRAQKAASYYVGRRYEQAEREAGYALQEALRHKDNQQAEEMRAIIKQSRAAGYEEHRRQSEVDAARLATVAQREKQKNVLPIKELPIRELPVKNTLDIPELGSVGKPVVFKKQTVGRSHTSGLFTKAQAMREANQTGVELYKSIVDSDGNVAASSIYFPVDSKPVTRTYTPEEQTAAQQWYWEEMKRGSQRHCASHPEDKELLLFCQ